MSTTHAKLFLGNNPKHLNEAIGAPRFCYAEYLWQARSFTEAWAVSYFH
jgi:hypothetical protein